MKDEKVKLDALVSSRLKAKAEQVCKDKRITMNQFVGRAFESYMRELKDREQLKGEQWQRYVFRKFPKKGSKEEEVLKYLLNNRIEGTRQVYSMPDLLEKCGLSLDEANKYLSNVYGLFIDEDKGCQMGIINPLVSLATREAFVELHVYRFGWEFLADIYHGSDPQEPSEEVKQIIAYLDSEEGRAEQEEFKRNYSKTLAEWLFGISIDEEDNQ